MGWEAVTYDTCMLYLKSVDNPETFDDLKCLSKTLDGVPHPLVAIIVMTSSAVLPERESTMQTVMQAISEHATACCPSRRQLARI